MIRAYSKKSRGIGYDDWRSEIEDGLKAIGLPRDHWPGNLPNRFDSNWTPEEVLLDVFDNLSPALLPDFQNERARVDLDYWLIGNIAAGIEPSLEELKGEIERELGELRDKATRHSGRIAEDIVRDPFPEEEVFIEAWSRIEREIGNTNGTLEDIRAIALANLSQLRRSIANRLVGPLAREAGEIDSFSDWLSGIMDYRGKALLDHIDLTREEVSRILKAGREGKDK